MSERMVLITGASTGIGRATAERLARAGFSVYGGVRSKTDADALRSLAIERLSPVFIDVTDQESIQAAAQKIQASVGNAGLFALINNAGIAVSGPLEFIPLADFRHQLEVNVTGQIAVTQAFLPLIRQANGRIVFMGSIGGRSALPYVGAYNASKFALEGLVDTLRVELRPWQIQVAVIEPGVVKTPIWDKALEDDEESAGITAARSLYSPLIDAMQEAFQAANASGVTAERVADIVERALRVKNMRARYVVGNDARLRLLLETLPTVLRDWLIEKLLLNDP